MSQLAAQPTPWAGVGDLASLVDEDLLLELLNDSGLTAHRATPHYIRLKPEVGALVAVEIEALTSSGEQGSYKGYVRTHPGSRAAALAHKWTMKRTASSRLGEGVRLLATQQSVLFLFPNDASLRGLRQTTDVDKLKRTLSELRELRSGGYRVRGRHSHLDIVRYKPERRLVTRARLGPRLGLKNDDSGLQDERTVFLRLFPDATDQRLDASMRWLQRQPVGPQIPHALGALRDGQLSVESAVHGSPLLAELLRGRIEAEAVAELVSLLHASSTPATSLELDLPPSRPLETAIEAARVLSSLGVSCAEELVSQLQARAPEPSRGTLVHGDCHLEQFLVDPEGRVVLVDFERLAIGSPLGDLGRLVADLEIAAMRSPTTADALGAFRDDLMSHYTQMRPGVDLRDLAFYVGCGHLDRALLPFRSLEPGWAERCQDIVGLGLAAIRTPATLRARRAPIAPSFFTADPDLLPEGLRWESFHPRAADIWPGSARDGRHRRVFGVYERSTGQFRAVDPAHDSELPTLPGWAAQGKLISYRPTRRATVQITQPAGHRYVKIVRRARAAPSPRGRAGAGRPGSRAAVSRRSDPARLRPRERNVRLRGGARPVTPLDPRDGRREGLGARDGAHRSKPGLVPPGAGWSARSPACRAARPRAVARLRSRARRGARTAMSPDPGHARTGAVSKASCTRSRRSARWQRLGRRRARRPGRSRPLGVWQPHARRRQPRRSFRASSASGQRDLRAARAQAHSFAEAYADAGGHAAEGAFSQAVALTLFRLACVYRFRRRWSHLPPVLLDEAEHWATASLTTVRSAKARTQL